MAMVQMPRPAEGVKLFLLGDEGILFDQPGQRLFHLNAAAACIWCHAEDGREVEAITDAVARSMRLGRDRAAQFVLEMLETWQHLGLFRLMGLRRPVDTGALPADFCQTTPAPSCVLGLRIAPRRRQYRLLGTTFSLGFSSEALEGAVHSILEHLELPRKEQAACQLDLIEAGGEVHVVRGGDALGHC